MNMAMKACGLMGATFVFVSIAAGAQAQTTVVSPLLDPVISKLPAVPSGAQKSYDPLSVEQLMKMVELTRTVGGSINQLFQTVINQTASLDKIRDGQLGAREIPLHNSPDEVAARDGGPGLKEMADSALSGSIDAPPAVAAAFGQLRSGYALDTIFALKEDKDQATRFIAGASAVGGVSYATAEQSFKRANAGMERLDDYITAIKDSTDLKTSVDLNTRVMVELTQQFNESLRVQASMAAMMGTYFMMMGGEAGRAASLAAK